MADKVQPRPDEVDGITAFKLLRVRKDGSLGPLFINRRQRIPIGVPLTAEVHPTKGFALRPGWHASHKPEAPHLTNKGRAWYKVKLNGALPFTRPEAQGGKWFIAREMTVIEPYRGPADAACTTV